MRNYLNFEDYLREEHFPEWKDFERWKKKLLPEEWLELWEKYALVTCKTFSYEVIDRVKNYFD